MLIWNIRKFYLLTFIQKFIVTVYRKKSQFFVFCILYFKTLYFTLALYGLFVNFIYKNKSTFLFKKKKKLANTNFKIKKKMIYKKRLLFKKRKESLILILRRFFFHPTNINIFFYSVWSQGQVEQFISCLLLFLNLKCY